MPHLYLHQRNADRCLEDLEGAEYPDLETAVDEAVITARQLMAEHIREGIAPDGWRFEISDQNGAILAVVPFRETISEDGSISGMRPRWFRVDRI